MRIVADENIPLLTAFFAGQGEVTTHPGRAISREHLLQADALLVRSVTQVTPKLLAGTPVRFVGTCTIGTDHLDLPGLTAAGVSLASAPGCNARGVVEYVLSCLLTLAERTGQPWRSKRVGIIGVGEVGGRLAETLTALGVDCLRCDPPRAERGEQGFVSLDTLLAQADVISCHVPLQKQGAYATHHLLDAERLASLKRGTWLINSSRGPVIDNTALATLLPQRPDLQVALDVWEHEPQVNLALAARCALASPHVAGYSLDGKLRGTEQIYQAFCAHFQQPASLSLSTLAPSAGLATLTLDAQTPADWSLAKALRLVYDVRDDDARFRAAVAGLNEGDEQIAQRFDQLRKHYPLRRECSHLRLLSTAGADAPLDWAAAGFSC
ncbi:MAG: 4-phosphoerythronate dehydrogenase PdxB [Halopseudomonas sp.]|uniref:4-phosphoerythronate dehydrogenase PdxB n=1 Tax=Halopseudomonas sp. TaxID=2901191 RepID=UPI00300392F7